MTGLTTAAGIWVTGAIGLALGGGLYGMAILCLVLLMICMEALHFYSFKLGDRKVVVTLLAQSQKDIESMCEVLGKRLTHCSWSKDGESYKASLSLLVRKKVKDIIGHSPDWWECLIYAQYFAGRTIDMVREGFNLFF